eukprot:scaffold87474_cov27-Tisochrysis_lutea.AAC.1
MQTGLVRPRMLSRTVSTSMCNRWLGSIRSQIRRLGGRSGRLGRLGHGHVEHLLKASARDGGIGKLVKAEEADAE